MGLQWLKHSEYITLKKCLVLQVWVKYVQNFFGINLQNKCLWHRILGIGPNHKLVNNDYCAETLVILFSPNMSWTFWQETRMTGFVEPSLNWFFTKSHLDFLFL